MLSVAKKGRLTAVHGNKQGSGVFQPANPVECQGLIRKCGYAVDK